MQINLTGRTAIITGAAGGLGKAYALALAGRGAAIVVNDLGGDTRGTGGSSALADAVVDEIRTGGGRAIANADSVATQAGGEAITRAALDAFGGVDIVINNAGNLRNALLENLSEEDIDAALAVHLKGAFFVAQPAYRLMKKNGYGRIISPHRNPVFSGISTGRIAAPGNRDDRTDERDRAGGAARRHRQYGFSECVAAWVRPVAKGGCGFHGRGCEALLVTLRDHGCELCRRTDRLSGERTMPVHAEDVFGSGRALWPAFRRCFQRLAGQRRDTYGRDTRRAYRPNRRHHRI
jgi:hypothetical protein